MPSEIMRQFETERDMEILAAIERGDAFTDIAAHFCVSEDHVQALWEAYCATEFPEE